MGKGRLLTCLGVLGLVGPGALGQVSFHFDPGNFDALIAGKVSKATWGFEPTYITPGFGLPIDDPLDIDTHAVNAFGHWIDGSGVDLWPDELDNVRFTSNMNPQGVLVPRGVEGLFHATAGANGLVSPMVGANFFVDSFDLVVGPPAGDAHTAVSFELLQAPGFQSPRPTFHVTVYDPQDNQLGKAVFKWETNVPIFVGVVADPGLVIGRVDIWDEAGGLEGIASLALYRQPQPVCPADCEAFPDGEVGVNDFLAVLAQWNLCGTSCDVAASTPCVDVDEFLAVLAAWGVCPTPANDECVDAHPITRLDDTGSFDVHLDLRAATASPQAYGCLGAPPIHDDTWHCIENLSGEAKLVTLTTTIDVFVDVHDGCACAPPGPIAACGRGTDGVGPFTMAPGARALVRLIDDLGLPGDELVGTLVVANEPAPSPVTLFLDPRAFDVAVQAAGKTSKLDWDFTPNDQPAGMNVLLDDGLNQDTHGDDPGDPWTTAAGTDLWPPEVDNLTFSSNTTPQGPLTPFGADGIGFGSFGVNYFMVAFDSFASFDIVSGPPAGDEHTAIAFDATGIFGPGPPVFEITVYDPSDVELAAFTVNAPALDAKVFVGLLSDVAIGRIDVWDINGSLEGVTRVEAWGSP